MFFPFFKQLDSMDCGPTCLRMVAKHYGKTYSLQALRQKSHITREGVSMLGISDAAEAIGFRTRGYRLTWEQLRDEVPLPCIVHWNQRHFIVVYDIKKNKKKVATVRVADPAAGLLEYTEEEFKKRWLSTKTDGVALLLEPVQSSGIIDGFEEMVEYNSMLFRTGKIVGVPSVFVNGYPLPNNYTLDDINYHIPGLEKMRQVLNEIEV